MPRVHALLGPAFNGQHDRDVFAMCEEIVPSGLNSGEGPLNPGQILFSHQHVKYGLESYDLLIEVEAHPFTDRVASATQRKHQLQAGFESMLPFLKPLVYLKFLEGHWGLPDSSIFNPAIDMSMQAAAERALERMDLNWLSHLHALEAKAIVGN